MATSSSTRDLDTGYWKNGACDLCYSDVGYSGSKLEVMITPKLLYLEDRELRPLFEAAR